MVKRLSAEEMRQYRVAHPDYVETGRRRSRAARKADSKLRALHPGEWRVFFEEALKDEERKADQK